MAKKEVLGSSVKKEVIDQIHIRENAFGSTTKSRSQIQFTNSNTSWVKLRSSVNEVKGNQIDILRKKGDRAGSTGNSIPAQNYVLTGGTLNPESQQARAGILRSPVSDNPNAEGRAASLYRDTEAYINYDSMGIRPMPGVTSFDVKSFNTYGTLMEANVNFTLWSREQLEDAELLFFRPGYTALLEWGHSVYLDNGGDLRYASKGSTVNDNLWLGSNRAKEIEKEIDRLRTVSKWNYDGIFGYITNFNWKFRPDGGYDCSVKIVSRGQILESLKNAPTSNNVDNEELPDQEKDKNEKTFKELTSTMSSIISKLDTYDKPDSMYNGTKYLSEDRQKGKKIAQRIKDTLADNEYTLNYNGGSKDFYVWRFKIKEKQSEGFFSSLGAFVFGDTVNVSYIRLKTFLSFINAFELLKNPAKNNEVITPFSLEYGNKYKTFSQHFSIDPLNVIKPTVVNLNTQGRSVPLVVGLESSGISLNEQMNKHVKANTLGEDKNQITNDIMNIMVSTSLIKAKFEALVTDPNRMQVNLYDFIKSILTVINAAFSNIPQLDIFYDQTRCVYMVVDRGNPIKANKENVINVTGLKNTVSELSVESQITKNMAAQVSIAAQGNTGNYTENLQNILQWNEGAIDRHIVAKEQGTAKTVKSPEQIQANAIKPLALAFETLAGESVRTGNLIIEYWDQVKAEGRKYTMVDYSRTLINSNKPDPLPIPITLNFKILGISGFKIGSSFHINKQILPKKYHKFAYIITGLSHTIGSDNRWYTNVETQFYKQEQ